MRVFLLATASPLLAAAAIAVGCGAASSSGATPSDAGAAGDALHRLDASDDATDASEEPSGDDGSTSPFPRRLLVSGPALPLAITASSDLVYLDSPVLYAVPVAGGTPAIAFPSVPATGFRDGTQGPFFWLTGTDAQGAGVVAVWSRATGPAIAPSPVSPVQPVIDAAGARVLFVRPGAAPGLVDVHGSAVSFAADATLVSGAESADVQQLAWVGSTAVVGAAVASQDAGGASFGVSTFSGATWTGAALAPNLAPTPAGSPVFLADPSGAAVVAIAAGGEVTRFALGGGAPQPIDPGGSSLGYFLSDGRVVYATSSALRVSPAAAPSPQTLLGATVAHFLGLSPDEHFLLFDDAPSTQATIHLTSTGAPAVDVPLGPSASSDRGVDVFTADSRFTLLLTNVGTSRTGDLTATPTGGGPPRVIASAVAARNVWALSASAVLMMDHVAASSPTSTTSDLEWADVSSSAPPTRLATALSTPVAVSPDRKHAAYFDPNGKEGAGIYVVDFP